MKLAKLSTAQPFQVLRSKILNWKTFLFSLFFTFKKLQSWIGHVWKLDELEKARSMPCAEKHTEVIVHSERMHLQCSRLPCNAEQYQISAQGVQACWLRL